MTLLFQIQPNQNRSDFHSIEGFQSISIQNFHSAISGLTLHLSTPEGYIAEFPITNTNSNFHLSFERYSEACFLYDSADQFYIIEAQMGHDSLVPVPADSSF